jgi:putative isomerase
MSWGTSVAVGDGLYKGTKLGAKNESSMDNSPIHDEAQYDPKSGCLDAADVGLNSLIALDGEILALMARARGDVELAERLEDRAAALRARIRDRLWDSDRAVFANRRWNGAFVRSLAPTSFYPFLADAATPEQQVHLLYWLSDLQAFGPLKSGGAHRLPSVTRDDPAYHDNVYWRGRVWPPLNYLTYAGLKRCGFDVEAEKLAADSVHLFAAAWAKRQMPENFSAETGAADDQPDTDLFYGWGGLMPLIGVNRVIDVSPWHGWEIHPRPAGAADDWRLGPLMAFGGRTELGSRNGWLTLRVDGVEVFKTDITTKLRRIAFGDEGLAMETAGGGTIVLPARKVDEIAQARFAAQDVAVTERGGGVTIAVPHAERPSRLEIHWSR